MNFFWRKLLNTTGSLLNLRSHLFPFLSSFPYIFLLNLSHFYLPLGFPQPFLSSIPYLPLFFLLFSTFPFPLLHYIFPFPLLHYTFPCLSLILIYLYLFTNFSSLSLVGASKNRELSRKSKVCTVDTEIAWLGFIFLSFQLKFQFIKQQQNCSEG